ncbi:hypothetical protein ANO14919_010860 [Xylariales sp. No.14919]|nr:hypothetical protein ANO14919_010860 [Xylariales sp. No.14919]
MSGVRNLRAMFEQKGDALPDRGRSPGPGGFGPSSPSASPRPLSKVRTSFVAVEKDGRIGLRREPSEDSVSVSSRKLSNDTDATTPQPVPERSDVFSDKMANTVASFKTNLSYEAIPESPAQDTPASFSPKRELKTPPSEPNANPDKITDQEEPQTKMLSGDPTETSAARLGGTVFNEGISDALNGTPSVNTKAKSHAATKPTSKATAPVPTAKTTNRTSKSPSTAKALSGKESTKPPSSSTNPKKAATTKVAATKPAPISLSPSDTGFTKPKPKSPTRPVKLPSSLTTHTAASAQKLGSGNVVPAPRQSLSRASGNAQYLSANPTTHRPPSRNSVSTMSTTTTKTLKHKPSNIGRPRPSLGPPPKQETKHQAATKKESHVDEGFLARMMRPTQSSSKKTSEKAPATPPRKQNAPMKKPDVKDGEKNATKVAAKIQASSTQAKATKDNAKLAAVKEQPTAKEVAPTVAETGTAETTIDEAKLSTDTAERPVEDKKIETEPTADDIAVVVAQEERAEDIIETANTSAETTVTADIPSEEKPEIAEVQNVSELAASAKVDTSEPAAPVPAVSEDPLKVEDIEDTVQEAPEPSHQLHSTDSTADAAQLEGPLETKGSTAASTGETNVDIEGAADEPLQPEETVAAAEDTASEEAKTEGSTTTDTLDGTTDVIEEATTKDAMATETAP